MKEMTVTDLLRYINRATCGCNGMRFCFKQDAQEDRVFASRTRLSMWFDELLVTPSPQAIHLTNSNGSFTIGNVESVRVERCDETQRVGAGSITAVCRNGERYKLLYVPK